VNSTDQHNAEGYPHQTREPTKRQTGRNRTRNWTSRRNRGKVLAEKVKRFGGNKVFPVVYLMRRSGSFIIKRKLARNPSAIRKIGCRNQNEENRCDARDAHCLTETVPKMAKKKTRLAAAAVPRSACRSVFMSHIHGRSLWRSRPENACDEPGNDPIPVASERLNSGRLLAVPLIGRSKARFLSS
jgi:hypothetical protein